MRLNNGESIVEFIPLDMCYQSDYNPFCRIDDENDLCLIKSIGTVGLVAPIIVRPVKGRYEVVVGRRRFRAFQYMNLGVIPAIVRKLTDDEAKIIVLETNINQRGMNDLKHSELADIIYEYHESIKSQGRRSDIVKEVTAIINDLNIDNGLSTFGPVGEKLDSAKASGQKFKLSPRAISRYLRIHQLCAPLKELLDNGIISVRTAVELSFLTLENQYIVVAIQKKFNCSIRWNTAMDLRQLQVLGEFSHDAAMRNLTLSKNIFKERVGFKPMTALFRKYRLQRYSVDELKVLLDKALSLYFNEFKGK